MVISSYSGLIREDPFFLFFIFLPTSRAVIKISSKRASSFQFILFSVYHKNSLKSIFIKDEKSYLLKKKIFDNYKEMLYNNKVCFDLKS